MLQTNSINISLELNAHLAEELNEEMKSTVMPVTAFVGLETVFGFLGNLMILHVFLFHYKMCNFKYFVLCLGCVDTISTVTTMPGEIVTHTFWFVYPLPTVCKIKSFFNMFTVCGSAFGLLIISVDRFRKICRPLDWQIKPKMAVILILVQFSIAFVIASPVPFFWGTNTYQTLYRGYNITVTVCEKDAKFKYTQYPLVYTVITEIIIASAMLVMFIMYVFVCRQLLNVKLIVGDRSEPANRKFRETMRQHSGGLACDEDTAHSSPENKDDATSCDTIPEPRYDEGVINVNKKVISTTDSSKSIPIKWRKDGTMSKKKTPRQKRLRRLRRKTLIMFILTALFIFTTTLYLTLLNLIANDVLQTLSKSQKSVYFFFFRLYFVNHLINPILYGMLDPQFRRVLKQSFIAIKNRFINEN